MTKALPNTGDNQANAFLRPGDVELSAKLVASVRGKIPDGGNAPHVQQFLSAVQFLLASGNYQTFGKDDIFRLTRSYDLPLEEVDNLFSQWIRLAVKAGRVREITSCYDSTLFEII